MNYFLTAQEIRDLIGIDNLAHPAMDGMVRAELSAAARVIDTLGLPKEEADWFKCFDTLVPFPDAQGKSYFIKDDEKTISRAVAIGRSEFGTHVIDCDTGCLVYVDSAGATQLLNTSIEGFLQFIGHFNRASNEGFDNCEALRDALEAIDPAALYDIEGIWSVTLESAEAGLF